MRTRMILFGVLIFIFALAGCVPAQQPIGQQPEPAVEGEEVVAGEVRLFSDPQRRNLAFEIEPDGRVYPGPSQTTDAILFFDGKTIFRGASATGEKLFTVRNNSIFVGASTTGPRAYTVQNGRVFEGTTTGPILFTISGDRLFEGPNTTGDTVFKATQNLTGNVQFLLPILAEQRF